MRSSQRRSYLAAFLTVIFLAACQGQPTPAPSPLPGTPLPSINTPVPPTPTATLPPKPSEKPTRSLVICLGQEPSSLYVYGASSVGMWSVLEGIYDGPIDTRQYAAQPVILEKLPSLADQDAVFEPVEVKAGDLVVDADGNPISLAAGARVLPSGCSGADCAQTWDGKKALQMDRLKVSFRLLPNLKWSDGAPLTAADSVYSFNLAADPATKVSKRIVDLTASYQAVDDVTVEWTGHPGFAPQSLDELFFLPLPKHAWGKYKPAEMENVDEITRKPLGWGPYMIEDWKAGDNILLRKNPNYFRASEGLPKFDNLVFRFLGEPGDNNLAALQAGECDLIDQTTLLEDQLPQILELQTAKKLQAYIGQGPDWEHLDFNLRPAAEDNGANPAQATPDFFGELKVRQAFAYCIDRQNIIQTLYEGLSSIPTTFLPPGHPMSPQDIAPLPYDAAKGNQLLTEAGWVDEDHNPATPRIAQGVANVRPGTPFEITYYTTQATARTKTADLIAKNLAECGVKVNVQALDPSQLYAPGPDGVLFGRTFDLAQFSWATGSQPPCFLYETQSIPTAKNNWIGGNLTGYSSQDYDAACQKAREARLDSADRIQAYQETARLFSKDLPALPLYFPLKIAISRADFCNMKMDVTARSSLWNLESFDINPACQP
jgi:peptide/nickel transport system substrate-binding protein